MRVDPPVPACTRRSRPARSSGWRCPAAGWCGGAKTAIPPRSSSVWRAPRKGAESLAPLGRLITPTVGGTVIVRDVGPRILRHVAKEVKHEQFYDLDVLTVTVDTRALV